MTDNTEGKRVWPGMDLTIPLPPDTLAFCDPDVREVFEGCTYFTHEPLLAQLIKELRKLHAVMAA